jgi:hypothetical protein
VLASLVTCYMIDMLSTKVIPAISWSPSLSVTHHCHVIRPSFYPDLPPNIDLHTGVVQLDPNMKQVWLSENLPSILYYEHSTLGRDTYINRSKSLTVEIKGYVTIMCIK